jgi:hypothetical protein
VNDMTKPESSFERLSKINVNDKLEKKNGLSYLSWAWALDQLMRADPESEWHYEEPKTYANGTMMVFCTVTAFGKKKTAFLPVMDYKNRAIPDPNAFEVNTAMQRCFVKAIAMHGLGLYIYAGEDLPNGEAAEAKDGGDGRNPLTAMKEDAFNAMPPAKKEIIRRTQADLEALLSEGRNREAAQIAESLEMDDQLALSCLMGSKERAALKKAIQELRGETRTPKLVDRNTRAGAPAGTPQ